MRLNNKKKHARWRLSPQTVVMGVMLAVILLMAAVIWHNRAFMRAQISSALSNSIRPYTSPKEGFYRQSLKYLPASTITPVEKVSLHVDYKNYQKLAFMRQQALDDRAKKDFTYVKAELESGQDVFKAKIRLKGDRKLHFNHASNWSFRVKINGDRAFQGMKYFSLQKPVTKNYIYEWLYHKALEREDVLSLQYKFVNLFMNGTDLGIYAIEEHFEKRLIERQKRREGPIIRFDESGLWSPTGLANAEIISFHVDKEMPEASRRQLQAATDLLEGFRRKDLAASEVFNIQKLAMFFAASDLLGTLHGTAPRSTRFYYNPVDAKLEPIGFDGHYGTEKEDYISAEAAVDPRCGWLHELHGTWYELFFNGKTKFDRQFFEAYITALKKVSSPEYLTSMLSELQPEIEQNLAILHKDFPLKEDHIFTVGPDMFVFDPENLVRRQKYITSLLSETPGIQVFTQQSSEGLLRLAFANTFRLPVEIVSVAAGKTDLMPAQDERILLAQRVSSAPETVPEFREWSFTPSEPSPEGTLGPLENITVTYRIVGCEQTFEAVPQPFPFDYQAGQETAIMRSPGTHLSFPFIRVEEGAKRILITKGSHAITSDLIFPQGYTVVAGPGVILDLQNSAMILSKSPLCFIGSEENPVIIESTDGTGQGLCLILDSIDQKTSVFEQVHFRNLTSPQRDKWGVTGAVTIYQAQIDISDSTFSNNQSEDCLNLVRSPFRLSDSTFSATFSDALDLDFSDGHIANCTFTASGNDAIDLSGSTVTIRDVAIDKVGDKAISVGEGSTATASGVQISGAEIALTCKDKSKFEVDACDITTSRIGVAAYQKKPEFGPASIIISNLSLSGAEIPYMIEENSTLTLDGKSIPSTYESVKDILYGVEFGKSSK